jgi:hypothetical protein
MNPGDLMYLLNPKKNKSAAHHWDGRDTLCRLFSTGGLTKHKQEIFNSPMGKPICLMCSNVFRRAKVDLTAPSVYDGGIPAKGPENAAP